MDEKTKTGLVLLCILLGFFGLLIGSIEYSNYNQEKMCKNSCRELSLRFYSGVGECFCLNEKGLPIQVPYRRD